MNSDMEKNAVTEDTGNERDELAALRAENSDLRAQVRKLNRQVVAQQTTIARTERAAVSRDKIASALKSAQSKQEKYMNMMLENSSNIIILMDNGGHFAYCTKTFLRLAGIESFEAIDGRHFSEVFARFHNPVFLSHVENSVALAQGGPETVSTEEVLDIGGTGEPRIYVTNTTAMRDSSGKWKASCPSSTTSRKRRAPRKRRKRPTARRANFLPA